MRVKMTVLKDEAGSYMSKKTNQPVAFRRIRGYETEKGGFDGELSVELDPAKTPPALIEDRSEVLVNLTGIQVFDRDVRFRGILVTPATK